MVGVPADRDFGARFILHDAAGHRGAGGTGGISGGGTLRVAHLATYTSAAAQTAAMAMRRQVFPWARGFMKARDLRKSRPVAIAVCADLDLRSRVRSGPRNPHQQSENLTRGDRIFAKGANARASMFTGLRG
jgi:hypothetical protein